MDRSKWKHCLSVSRTTEKIQSKIKYKPTETINNGGQYPMEWWGEDVKNIFGQSDENKFVHQIRFENGLTTHPLNNNFEIGVPTRLIHSAKVKYTMASQPKRINKLELQLKMTRYYCTNCR